MKSKVYIFPEMSVSYNAVLILTSLLAYWLEFLIGLLNIANITLRCKSEYFKTF